MNSVTIRQLKAVGATADHPSKAVRDLLEVAAESDARMLRATNAYLDALAEHAREEMYLVRKCLEAVRKWEAK